MVIREVTAKQEVSEAKLVEERTADLKKELDDVKEQLEDLSDARRRQEILVENIVVQRDMFKAMAESRDSNTSMVTSTPAPNAGGNQHKTPTKSPGLQSQAEVRAARAEAALDEIKKDFQVC